MRELSAKPLSSFRKEWTFLPQKLVPIDPATSAVQAPEGMVAIPGTEGYVFAVSGIEIEGGDDIKIDIPGVDVQYPWEDAPRRHHVHKLEIKPFFIDKYP